MRVSFEAVVLFVEGEWRREDAWAEAETASGCGRGGSSEVGGRDLRLVVGRRARPWLKGFLTIREVVR